MILKIITSGDFKHLLLNQFDIKEQLRIIDSALINFDNFVNHGNSSSDLRMTTIIRTT